ncbi:MAG: hypothetical protein A2017_13575 [Lentisphaerae bacterium GWF2_44_16]|nr:MAG: hypothetical protein A2017_13575 [Lentisphaerae bacterium GWF2_44_16]
MFLKKMPLFLSAGLISFLSCAASELLIPIHIDIPEKCNIDWSITCGIPLPKGKYNDISLFSVVDAKGKTVPSQIDKTATWRNGFLRWMLVNFQASPGQSYFFKTGKTNSSETQKGIEIKKTDKETLINTGKAEFTLKNDEALISSIKIGNREIISDSSKDAYLVDNRGRKAYLGGKDSEIETKILLNGKMSTVIRKEGWYVTENDKQKIARGIVWLYFYGNSPYVKLVHRLVLTEDTNNVWFKDIGINFNMNTQDALFAVAKGLKKPLAIEIKKGDEAWMLQEDFPHFMSEKSNFSLIRKTVSGKKEISSGKQCGDWCDISSEKGGMTVVLRDFAEQFPKEFTVTDKGLTVHLWAGRCGRELDFRTPTLIKEYWGEWTKYFDAGVSVLEQIPSNAQCSAKTHVLWLLPHSEKETSQQITEAAYIAAEGALVYPEPSWICATETIGPPMLQKDSVKYSEEEAFISDTFDRILLPEKYFPFTGYICWGANPATRYGKDATTGKYYGVWWRVNGIIDYLLRRNVWTLYARSGERKYFKFGEKFNRFIGDMNMHHWDNNGTEKEGNKKVKGAFAGGPFPKSFKNSARTEIDNVPFYWGWASVNGGGSGIDSTNMLLHFYFTGEWDVWEYADNNAEAIKKNDFLQIKKVDQWMPILPYVRNYVNLYSMKWDKQLGEIAKDLTYKIIDPASPNSISLQAKPSPLYKIGRNAIAMLDYYRFTDDEFVRNAFLKMIDYDFRFGGAKPDDPIGYQDSTGMVLSVAYFFTGDEKYFRRAYQTVDAGIKSEKASSKKSDMPYYTQCLNYQACLNMPVILKALSDYKGRLDPVPILVKNMDSTSNAWAVFHKEKDKSVDISMEVELQNADECVITVIGPDNKIVGDVEITKKEKRMTDDLYKASIYYFELKIPAVAPEGIYRLGHKNPGAFTIIDSNVKKMALEAPDGFWTGEYTPFYFNVPREADTVEIFTELPVEITKADGSPAKDKNGKESGKMSLPADGSHGFWKIESRYPSFIKFLNLPSVTACLEKERFFIPEKLMPAKSSIHVSKPGETFPAGVIGKSIQLGAKEGVRFNRGKKLEDGTYENFPLLKGTIEFYYRPNWSATDISFASPSDLTHTIINAGAIGIRYSYGYTHTNKANLETSLGQTKLADRGKKGGRPYGNNARFFPKAGDWVHIAVTWNIENAYKSFKKTDYKFTHEISEIFINGVKCKRAFSYPIRLNLRALGKNFTNDFEIPELPEWITLTPCNGSLDELRISDVVRYQNDFTPSDMPFGADKNTKLLMHFDNDITATNGNGTKIATEKTSAKGNSTEIKVWGTK